MSSQNVMPGAGLQGEVREGPSNQISHPPHVHKLRQLLDLNPFLVQLETLMATSIKVPADSLPSLRQPKGGKPRNVFSVRGIWKSEEDREKSVSAFYNFKTIRKRKWLKKILLEESDSESDGEQVLSEEDLNTILKIHRCRRKYQKNYHTDILNSQYTYYAAGLLSEEDRFPQHQQYIQEQYGFPAELEEIARPPSPPRPSPSPSSRPPPTPTSASPLHLPNISRS